MGVSIEVQEGGNLKLGNLYIIQGSSLPTATPTTPDHQNKLFVLNYTKTSNGKTIHVFESYVAHNGQWLKLDNTTVNIDTISPVDWGIDQFFGGDGGCNL